MDLNTIAIRLREQAAAKSTIVLDDSVLTGEVREKIRVAFALKTDPDLTIAGVNPHNIPEPSAEGVLTIAAGTATVLSQTNVPIGLTFTAANGTVETVIVAKMGESWEFKHSFQDFDTFPLTCLKISRVRFVYSTVDYSSYTWPDEPNSQTPLAAGLNFLSHAEPRHLSSIPSPVRELLGDVSRKFHGSLTLKDNQDWPVGTLRAPLSDAELKIGDDSIYLSVGAPKLALRIGEATDDLPVQPLDLVVEGRFQTLQVEVAIPVAGGALELRTAPLKPDASVAELIKQLPGGNFIQYIPDELKPLNLFDKVGLRNFSLVVTSQRKVTYVGLSVDTLQSWVVIPRFLTLENLALKLETVGFTDLNSMRAEISATAQFLPQVFTDRDPFTFNVELEKLNSSWSVKTISGSYYGSVSLSKIVTPLAGSGVKVPEVLEGIRFSDFGVRVHKETTEYDYRFYGKVETIFPILGQELNSTLIITVTHTGDSHTIHLGGGLSIGEQVFSLSMEMGQSNSKIEAGWEGTALGFGEIAAALGWDTAPQLPEVVDIKLKKVHFEYDFTARTLVLSAESESKGKVVFLSRPDDSDSTKQVYLFSLGLPLNLEFSKLPLVGDSLPANIKLGVDKLQVTAASAAPAPSDVTTLQERAGKELIPDSLGKGVTLGALLQMDGPRTVILPFSNAAKRADTEHLALAAVASDAGSPLATSTPRADPKWLTLNKTIGPVHFEKIGVQYQDSTLRLLLNVALSAAGLTLSVDGLGIGLKKFEPSFELRGLGIDYKNDAVEIGGTFLRTVTAGKPDSYDGAAVIKTKQFALSALGSYTTLDGEPSLFIYAFVNYPLGGPAFFFITGLAAGFGYNRRLIAPSVENVAEFPLVKQAVGTQAKPKDVMDALRSLQEHVPPNVGSIFLAVGVRFNSFKLIDSFALLTFEFGNNLAINLIGLSKAVVPTPDASKATPLAQVEIAWKATFNPDDGCLAIDARLTPNSYILSKDCRLSGGYAFYSWFTGPHAGDFVQTLGGYHPKFDVPAHYPKVPRLAFDWRVNNSLTIQGDAYYALTGSALMAGGHLEVLFREGELRAWLKLGADFLIAWKPYHYDASIYVSVGASYTFNINLLFTRVRVTISVDVGAHLHLWGPDFSGTARIDLSVISFTIAFGAGASQAPQPLENWSKFQGSFLPEPEQICSISVKDGLVRNIEAKGQEPERWVINPKQFSLVIDSAVPLKSVPALGGDLNALANVNIGIAPMSSKEKLKKLETSTLSITITKTDGPVTSKLKYSLIKKLVPAGLWGETSTPSLTGAKFLENVATGIEITPADPPASGETKKIDVDLFKFKNEPYPNAFEWEGGSKFVPSDVKIADSVASNKQRDNLLAELGMKFSIRVKKTVADDFVTAPQIGTLELCQLK